MIMYSQFIHDHAGRFVFPHSVHVPVANNKHLVVLTGTAIIDFKGHTSDDWRRDRLVLNLKFPSILPQGKAFKIEQWAPFVTINAIYNQDEADNAGWAVDCFGLHAPTQKEDMKTTLAVAIWADIAVRDSDGYLFRVAYNLTLSGIFA
jgi:hypothetical protein